MIIRIVAALGLACLVGGCGFFPVRVDQPVMIAPDMAADMPAKACPWVDNERGRAPVRLAGTPGAAPAMPAPFVSGCAIIRFHVAADGSVYKPALRSALPVNDGPTALASLQQMRFAPARRPETQFVIRLSMKRDSAGRVSVGTETRTGLGFFGGDS
jgi:hypothetical protein